MLTSETKRKINACRDILVGKIPDPKGQVDQITNALVYKFMDDQDRASMNLPGGKASFFTGEYEKYSWTKLFDPRLTNQDRANLYTEGLSKLSQAAHLPDLFKQVFKEAYLPFRDPATIAIFLNEINGFSYDHSEELGNAFEHLLLIMGSQGDAGQFRTPRHIIGFLVDVVDPQKDETIHDPACGTAGFLVEAFQHVTGAGHLSAPEKLKLAKNVSGIDIDPGMAKIARVNLYLHGFKTPQVTEDDTLVNEDLWGTKYDVILANPPFMTPKGGVKPHGKFTVQANRAEVLFTDWISEHLKLNGRAGIIVPEGIIFQSAGAYKELRKRLVEDWGLWAVVSLPAGVFQPYSGVKTSILFLDRQRAKTNADVAFVKIAADGFDLGAQRREIATNDLPVALKILNAYKRGERSENPLSQYVERSRIAEGEDYNLSVERYRAAVDYSKVKWPMVELGEVAEIRKGSPITRKDIKEGGIPVIAGGQSPAYFHSDNNRVGETITVSASGAYAGFVNFFETPIFASDCSTIQSKDGARVLTKYIFSILKEKQADIYLLQQGGGQPHVYPKDLAKIQIPLPPLDVQRALVAELDGYQKIISGARAIVENWKPKFVIDPLESKRVRLSDLVSDLEAGVSVNSENVPAGTHEFGVLKTSAVTYGVFNPAENKKIIASEVKMARVNPRADSIIVSRMNTPALVGASAYVDRDYPKLFLPDRLWQIVRKTGGYSMKFLSFVIASPEYRDMMTGLCGGTSGSMKNLSKSAFLSMEIQLPPLDSQEKIVAAIESERSLVFASQNLAEIYEQKTKDSVAKLWQ